MRRIGRGLGYALVVILIVSFLAALSVYIAERVSKHEDAWQAQVEREP